MTDLKEPMAQPAQPQEAAWISSMREHYVNTGNYRQDDVHRLLGAPWDRAEISTTSNGLPASRVAG